MFIKVCLLIGLATACMSLPAEAPKKPERTVDEHWADFKFKFNKKYDTPEEEARRFEIFKENLKKILKHNKRYEAGTETYKQSADSFSDLTREELIKIRRKNFKPKLPGLVGSK